MTFEEAEAQCPNGFHDAEIEGFAVDYRAGTLSLSMKLLSGTPGMPDHEDYCAATLRVNRLVFFAIEPPDPRYPFIPDGDSLGIDGAKGLGNSGEMAALAARFPAEVSCYRFFVEPWNSFIYVAGSDIELRFEV